MANDRFRLDGQNSQEPENPDHDAGTSRDGAVSRRQFVAVGAAGAAGLATGALIPGPLAEKALGAETEATVIVRDGNPRRKLLRGGIVLSLDSKVGDFENADVLIEGKKIVAVRPNAAGQRRNDGDDDRDGAGQVIDCSGAIVMPGFITTHHHQYETIMRSLIPDGLLQGAWPQESYGSVVQNIWTAGRIGPADNPTWDLRRPPMDPEDCYISELVACLSQITEGVTMGTDTSQASHTPEHTDAMIEGLMASGQRVVYDYSGGTIRDPQQQKYEHPGLMGDETLGVGRLAARYFSSDDQLVTLGLNAGPTPVAHPRTGEPQSYTGWQLARSFGALINNHNVGAPQTIINAAEDSRNGTDWSDVTMVHAVRWQDNPVGQVGTDTASRAWQIFADRGGHVSIADIIETQMRHGMPPFQLALNHGILPSLSPDVDTNMTTDPFSLMRGAFCLQRALANDLAFPLSNPGNLTPVPQLVTARQVIEMATIAGAAANRVLHKVGTLTPGKEADIVVLDARNITIAPMNNVPGTVVTMMNPRHVRDVLIAGKTVYRNGRLVGWDIHKLLRDIEASWERVLRRIQANPPPAGNNSFANPYRPNFLGSCCYNGQNTTSPSYVLRP